MLSIKSKFPYSYELKNTTIFLAKPVPPQAQTALLTHIRETKNDKKIQSINFGINFFIKTTPILKLAAKLRITLNIPRKTKGFDLPLADIKNSLDVQTAKIPAPELLGYGYERKFGLINKLTIIHENLEHHVDGFEWLQDNPKQGVELVEKTFELIISMHNEKKYHLDLWLKNIMLNQKKPEKVIAVDFEHYMAGESPNKDQLLGFIFGNFYRLELNKFVSEEDYNKTTKKFITRIKDLNEKKFMLTYEFSKKNEVSRKKRRLLFLEKVSFDL